MKPHWAGSCQALTPSRDPLCCLPASWAMSVWTWRQTEHRWPGGHSNSVRLSPSQQPAGKGNSWWKGRKGMRDLQEPSSTLDRSHPARI